MLLFIFGLAGPGFEEVDKRVLGGSGVVMGKEVLYCGWQSLLWCE